VRVDHDNVYEVYLSNDDVIHFPLILGQVNDVTLAIFNEIRKYATIIQLVSVKNNPGKYIILFYIAVDC